MCDLKKREFITCFQAVNLTVDEEQKEVCQDIHRENVLAYKHSQSKLLNRYRLKEAKELLANIEEHVDRFYSFVPNPQERGSQRSELPPPRRTVK